jgi:DNA-binding ferritin-like protein
MPKSITNTHLNQKITVVETDVKHIHDCIHRLEDEVKDNRKFFTTRLDRLDNRIWMIMALTFTTFVTLFASLLFS